MFRKFLAVLHARNIEFIRDKSAMGWNVIFPVLVVFGFSFAFSGGSKDIYKVGVLNPGKSELEFFKTKYVQFIANPDEKEAIEKVKKHQLDMLLDAKAPVRYWINSSSPKGYVLERMLSANAKNPFQKEIVEGREIRYVDWLISGLLAMNIMFSALYGVGYAIVRYRKMGVLKRLKATPLTSFEFLSAQLVSRLIIAVVINVIVYLGCHIFIHFHMAGSYFDLLFVLVLGSFCLITLGLVFAARTASQELADGLLNLISWPMMFLSGVWFSMEGTHPWVIKFSQIFPLTHMINAARAIMTEGASLTDVYPNLLILTVMSIVFLFIGSRTFKWE